METRNHHGFPTMICDYCDLQISNNDSMVVEGSAENKALNMVYHTKCWEKLTKEYPQIYQDCETKRLD